MKNKRTLALFLGIIFTLVFFEVVLRLIGHFNNQQRDTISKESSQKIKILTLGNSYTAGSGAPLGESYPNQLGRVLEKKSPGRYAVINHGLQNINTSFILEQLPGWLKTNSPDIVFLMVGEPNYWNKYNYSKFVSEFGANKYSDKYSKLENYLRWSKLYRWIELILNSDNVLYSFSKKSTTFKNVPLSQDSKKWLGYLWLGAFEKGFYTDRSSYLFFVSLGNEQFLEAEGALKFIYEMDKGQLVARKLCELYIFKARKRAADKKESEAYLKQSLVYLEKAIKSSDYFDIFQWSLLRIREYKNLPKKDELKKLMLTKMSSEEIIKLRQLIEKDLPVINISKKNDCLKVLKISDAYPSSITLTKYLLQCPIPIEMKWKVYERSLVINPFTPLIDFPGEGYALIKKHPEYKERFEKMIADLSSKIGPLEFFREIRNENLLKLWIESDLDKMTSLIKISGAKIVIQTYPPLRNGHERVIDLILRNWWNQRTDKNQIMFMDVQNLLRDKFSKDYGGDKFYSMERGPTDNHLNPQGNLEISKLMEKYIP